jgi:quercetin dioxygenase-like cupin family protein
VLASSPARLVIVEPHGPDVGLTPGFTASTRLTAADTGSISIVEHTFAPGILVPPHRHTHEDEISYVIEGEIGFRSGDHEVSLRSGGYIVKPRGELHAMWNASATPARMMEIVSPAGFERYFVDMAEAIAAAGGQRDPAMLAALRERYGLAFEFDGVPDLVARHGLRSPLG